MESPLTIAAEAAEQFSNPLAKSAILAAVAEAHFAAEQFDEMFAAADAVPNRAEKKGLLVNLASDYTNVKPFLPNKVILKIISALIKLDAKNESAAGRFALTLLDKENVDAALALINSVKKPFDSHKSRYDFTAKLLEIGGEKHVPAALNLLKTFEDADYRDWASLALCKSYVQWKMPDEAVKIAEAFFQPLRRSWAFFELSQMVPNGKKAALLKKSGTVLESFPVDKDNAEKAARQMRIIGKALYNAGETESGLQLLEQSEAAAAKIPEPMQRFKIRLLLAKVLRELGQIDSVQNYIGTKPLTGTEFNGIQRSELLQWFAEASPKEDEVKIWNSAVRTAAATEEKETNEFPRAEQIVEIVRNFSARQNHKPAADIPGTEEFDEYYFSPFAVTDCNCGS
ncbi:MAG: hypothetical protein LBN39_09845 [Planctomycetaceae bacterium]|jgi:tetratricopeptide (TPR) repeat protein|nr:hypothetical protein [Planctomycetaceae bacterium]